MKTAPYLAIALCGAAVTTIEMMPVNEGGNPAVNSAETIEANLNVPPQVEKILTEACKDCHSLQTRWPLYAKVAPVSWIVTHDVERGRKAMNLSQWAADTGSKRGVAMGVLAAACADVQSHRMPPAAYQRMHPAARLRAGEVETLCEWTSAETRLLRSQARLRSR
jgi:cytochrome c